MAPGVQSTPESFSPISVAPFSGSSFVGGPGGAAIDQYDTATGALIKSFTVQGGNDTGGTDWVDLELDGHTILYEVKGPSFVALIWRPTPRGQILPRLPTALSLRCA